MNATATIRPCGNRVVLERDDSQKATPGGILIPQTGDDRQQTGTVIDCGPGRQLENGERSAMDVTVGDRVLFYPGRALAVDCHDQKLLLIDADDILAILE